MSSIVAVISLFKRIDSSNVTLFTGTVLIAVRCQTKNTAESKENNNIQVYFTFHLLSLTHVLLRLMIVLEQIYRASSIIIQFWSIDFVIYSYTLHSI